MFNKIILLRVLSSDIEIIGPLEFHGSSLNMIFEYLAYVNNLCANLYYIPITNDWYDINVHPPSRQSEMFSKTVHRFNHVHNKSMVISNQLHKMPRIYRLKSIEHWTN